MEVGFKYGIICDKLEDQAKEQGFTLGEDAERLEQLRHALNLLKMNRVLSDSEVDKAFQRLHKKVIKALKPIEKQASQ